MRIANLAGRLVLVTDAGAVDVETASGGRFSPDPQAVAARDELAAPTTTTPDPAPPVTR